VLGHIGLITAGLLLITLGFWGGSRLRFPYSDLVALGAPVGLLVTLVGILLLIIPRFFA
jgi:hypothetical protein